MAKTPKNHRKEWTREDDVALRKLVRQNTPTPLIAYKMQRTEDAVRAHASEIDLSLKPTNQSPYGTKKTQNPSYKLSVGSADEYGDLIAEIHFPGRAGVIISQEKKPGEFEISLHSFREKSGDDFDYCRNADDAKIPLADLTEAIDKAVSELRRLKKV